MATTKNRQKCVHIYGVWGQCSCTLRVEWCGAPHAHVPSRDTTLAASGRARCARVRRWSRAVQPISGEYRLGSDGPVFPEISEFTWVLGGSVYIRGDGSLYRRDGCVTGWW